MGRCAISHNLEKVRRFTLGDGVRRPEQCSAQSCIEIALTTIALRDLEKFGALDRVVLNALLRARRESTSAKYGDGDDLPSLRTDDQLQTKQSDAAVNKILF